MPSNGKHYSAKAFKYEYGRRYQARRATRRRMNTPQYQANLAAQEEAARLNIARARRTNTLRYAFDAWRSQMRPRTTILRHRSEWGLPPQGSNGWLSHLMRK